MKSRWILSAGMMDAGFASLATFVVGIFAIRYFDPATLGGYALVFAAFKLAVFIPQEMIFLPAEIATVSRAPSSRLGLLPQSLRLGLLPAILAALLASSWFLAAPSGIPTHVVVAFTSTIAVCTFLSPIQDHLRRMLHIAGRSWIAAVVSVVQFVGTIGTLAYMLHLGVPTPWIPFGSLATANFLSLTTGVLLSQRGHRSKPKDETSFRFGELARSGGWFLFAGLLAPASFFVASALVTHLAGAEALGYAEAARVIAHPLPVFVRGLSAVLSPRSMEAAQKKQLQAARSISNLYMRLMGVGGIVYLAIAGFDVPWNPFAWFLPNAYVISGLASITILADMVAGILLPYRFELLGDRRAITLAKIEVVGAALRVLVGGTAGLTQAFAMPLGQAALGVTRAIGYRGALRDVYRGSSTVPVQESVPPGQPLRPVAVVPRPTPAGDR